jgi:hypothetical protein
MVKWTTPKSVRNGNAAVVVPLVGVLLVLAWIKGLGS